MLHIFRRRRLYVYCMGTSYDYHNPHDLSPHVTFKACSCLQSIHHNCNAFPPTLPVAIFHHWYRYIHSIYPKPKTSTHIRVLRFTYLPPPYHHQKLTPSLLSTVHFPLPISSQTSLVLYLAFFLALTPSTCTVSNTA